MGLLHGIFTLVKKQGKLALLLSKYNNDWCNSSLIDEIYTCCMNNDSLRVIMHKHKATKDDISTLYYALLSGGAGFKSKGHFPPVSSFFYMTSLDYLLTHKNDPIDELSWAMIKDFDS